MTTVIRRNPVNRLMKLVRRPGGPTVSEALAAAQDNLKSMQEECLQAMDAKLALISAAVARCRTQPTAEDTKILYDLSNDVLEIAGVFEMAQLGQAASSLCDLMDRCRTYGRWNQPALEVHLNGLIALRAAGGVSDDFTQQVLDGLRQVVDRVGRGDAPGA